MREATGELNVTVIVVSAVALLSAFFFTTLWPDIKDNMDAKEKCGAAVCDIGYNSNKMSYCYVPGHSSTIIECPFRG